MSSVRKAHNVAKAPPTVLGFSSPSPSMSIPLTSFFALSTVITDLERLRLSSSDAAFDLTSSRAVRLPLVTCRAYTVLALPLIDTLLGLISSSGRRDGSSGAEPSMERVLIGRSAEVRAIVAQRTRPATL